MENQVVKPAVKKITTSEIKRLLGEGYTRYKRQDIGHGSLEEHFGLTGVEIKEIFQHPKLKGLKTKFPSYELVDDLPDTEVTGILVDDDEEEEDELIAPVTNAVTATAVEVQIEIEKNEESSLASRAENAVDSQYLMDIL